MSGSVDPRGPTEASGRVRTPATIQAVCFDLGDTLVAEESVVHNAIGQSVAADVIQGTYEVLQGIRESGIKTALVTNGDSIGGRNLINYCKLEDHFDCIVISEEVGVEKPGSEIFETALNSLNVRPVNTVMVGNRIDADIVGANRMGLTSVWFKWNDRYEEAVESEEEKPDFTITRASELLEVLGLNRSSYETRDKEEAGEMASAR